MAIDYSQEPVKFPLASALVALDSGERAREKGLIWSSADYQGRRDVGGFTVEVIEVIPKSYGCDVLARAWETGRQIGFGNGTVDIERFEFHNPPILVPDGTKSMGKDIAGRDIEVDNYKEDPLAALLESLSHTIRVCGKVLGSERIIAGKSGHTVMTFYPEADPASVAADGDAVSLTVDGDTWANKVAANGTEVVTGASTLANYFNSVNSANKWGYLYRAIICFDTSAIGSDSAISAATLSLYGASKAGSQTNTNIYGSTKSSGFNAIVAADYQTCQSTAFSTTINYADWSTSAYNDFALNAFGKAAISKTSVSVFSMRSTLDATDTAPTWSYPLDEDVEAKPADTAGTSNDPKLVVTFAQVKTINGVAIASVKTINGLAIASVKKFNGKYV